ncbi:MAG: cell wall metabolism sensor histidine kinase WalK [Verrucomicrobiales bacterium]|jgi:two-component system phosphate regulon sensor histidine kinase PhoR|nr:cell wall metabolism sensor histidine kinase WalK [Verrucomicrobiales bacterium]
MFTLAILLGLLVLGGGWFYWRVYRAAAEIRDYCRQLALPQSQTRRAGAFGRNEILRNLAAIDRRLKSLDRRADAEQFSLQTILASMAEGVVIVDVNGVIQADNRAFQDMFALAERPAGRRVWEVLRQPEIKTLIEGALRERRQSAGELVYEDLLAAAGRRKAFRVSVSTLGDEVIYGAVAVFHDISRVAQLEELRKEFVADVSHELRTPLSIFRGYLETLLNQPELSGEERRRIFQVLWRHSDRLHSLVEDLLTLSRLESGHIQLRRGRVAVRQLFKQLREDWSAKFLARHSALTFDLADETLTVHADSFRVEQVFYNLLDNALKYSDPGPSQAGTGGEVRVGAQVSADSLTVRFYVRDAGIGIPSDKVDQVFQRFFRVDKARSRDQGGTGLGLAIVKHIVQLHGGQVWAESTLGKGTTVWFSLPC